MQQLHFSEPEIAELTQRAAEIAKSGAGGMRLEEEYAAFIAAAEEMGIPRQAALLALRERLQVFDMTLERGSRVFAPSVDGFLYSATVLEVQPHQTTVQFDAGGEQACRREELQPFTLTPGSLVQGCWKDGSWYSARVRGYDPAKKEAEVVYRSDGTVETLPLKRIRLRPSIRRGLRFIQWLPHPVLDLAAKLAAGGILGFLLAQLLR